MLDAPIPRTFTVDGHRLTVPLPEDAMKAIRDWEESRDHEIAALLAPFGLHPYEMPPTEWRRYVTLRDADELQEQADRERKELAERESIRQMLKAAGITYIPDSMIATVSRLAAAGVVTVEG